MNRLSSIALALAVGLFAAAAAVWLWGDRSRQAVPDMPPPLQPPPAARPDEAPPPARDTKGDDAPAEAGPVAPERPPPDIGAIPPSEEEAREDLRQRDLLFPIDDLDVSVLTSTFVEERGDRAHEALDLIAPRGTPVRAVEGGTVAKLFTSRAGGLTVYQFDPTRTYAYYYAHLDRYAHGLAEGARLRRGQVIGYVGSTGNASEDGPHLHFAVFILTPEKQWWAGRPVDPYDIWRP
jgi:peptidoglycan LD-endopeptidase LytH